jgi:hypothetical protein
MQKAGIDGMIRNSCNLIRLWMVVNVVRRNTKQFSPVIGADKFSVCVVRQLAKLNLRTPKNRLGNVQPRSVAECYEQCQ